MRYLTLGEILAFHDYQIERFGGKHGIINPQLVESSVFRPRTVLYDADLYPSVFDKAAVLAMSIIQFHPFVDGNKRTGIYSAIIFLELNGFEVYTSKSRLVNLANKILNKKINLEGVSKVLKSFSVSLSDKVI